MDTLNNQQIKRQEPFSSIKKQGELFHIGGNFDGATVTLMGQIIDYVTGGIKI
jgi:hypothetical protein